MSDAAPEALRPGPRPGRRYANKVLTWALQALLLVTAVCVFVPFTPAMPGVNLDQAWAFGMNEAVAQGWAFGREIVFTFGPYASIYSGSFHPATDLRMVTGSIFFSLCFGLAAILVTRNSPWTLTLGLCVVLAGFSQYSRDALFLYYPLLVAILCFQFLNSNDGVGSITRRALLPTAVLFLPFGLLPQIKGSFLFLCLAVAALAVVYFALRRCWRLALVVVLSTGLSTIFFWSVAGLSPLDLPPYFISMFELTSGYTEAMADDGPSQEIVFYLIAVAAIVMAIVGAPGLAVVPRGFLFFSFLAFLFLVFKGSFVRHDLHALLAGTSILMAALLLATIVRSSWTPLVLFSALLCWIQIDSHHVKTSTQSLIRNIGFPYVAAAQGIRHRLTDSSALESEFRKTVQGIASETPLRRLEGSTDIYSYGQSGLVASGNRWHPRPVFQSYAVYTAALALKNRNHLLGDDAPDNIVFRLEPIDGHLPSMEDGASWATLLTHYRPNALAEDRLYLSKAPPPAALGPGALIGTSTFMLGAAVPVPQAPAPVFAEISIRPTLFGKLMSVLYKPDRLQIELTLANGTSKAFGIVSGMVRSGIMVSPLVEDVNDLAGLYGGVENMPDKRVVSFSITSPHGTLQWNEAYEVTFRAAATAPPMDTVELHSFDAALNTDATRNVLPAASCEGGIDAVNGVSPPPAAFAVSGILNVHGWMAMSVKPGIVPETVLVVLSDDRGRQHYFNTRKTLRPDVGSHFKDPALAAAGYVSKVDVRSLDGEYTLGLAYREGEHIRLCPPSAIRGRFKRVESRG
ncbi:MAG: hypothetical protein IH627_22230 [Rubrivivax sp.]|nr:hypothetical protein [Rubrivivax sp.]